MQRELNNSFDNELRGMSSCQLRHFSGLLIDVLNDRAWCLANAIPYLNPDIMEASQALFLELKEFEYFR